MSKRTFSLVSVDGYFWRLPLMSDGRMAICRRGLRQYFNIPSSTDRIYVTLSSVPVRGAVPLRVSKDYCKASVDGGRPRDITASLHYHLEELGGRAWLWVEYEA